ncbi:unnamed protein product [Caenorhabditis auriculariae]|uniref:Uncharacterized protein n=1 Tax=Caenorhabditis auriculariae TaxID=2777116 RepID=A0A8S1HLZ5_9PELO|nr:unnamed protein product [Caenorhabditis auriculariae]
MSRPDRRGFKSFFNRYRIMNRLRLNGDDQRGPLPNMRAHEERRREEVVLPQRPPRLPQFVAEVEGSELEDGRPERGNVVNAQLRGQEGIQLRGNEQDEASEEETRRRRRVVEVRAAPRRMLLIAHDPLWRRYHERPRRQEQDEEVEEEQEEEPVARAPIADDSDSSSQEEEMEAQPARARQIQKYLQPLPHHEQTQVESRGPKGPLPNMRAHEERIREQVAPPQRPLKLPQFVVEVEGSELEDGRPDPGNVVNVRIAELRGQDQVGGAQQDEASEEKTRRRRRVVVAEARPAPRRMLLIAHDPLWRRYHEPPRRQEQDEEVEEEQEEEPVARAPVADDSDSSSQEEEMEAQPARGQSQALKKKRGKRSQFVEDIKLLCSSILTPSNYL